MTDLLGVHHPPPVPATSEEKTMALLGVGLSLVAPLLAPLIIWAIQKDKMPFTARVCWRFMVFDGVLLAIGLVSFVVMTVLSFIPILGCLVFCLMVVLFGGVGVWALVVTIMGLVRINEGNEFIPPFADQLFPPPAGPPAPPDATPTTDLQESSSTVLPPEPPAS